MRHLLTSVVILLGLNGITGGAPPPSPPAPSPTAPTTPPNRPPPKPDGSQGCASGGGTDAGSPPPPAPSSTSTAPPENQGCNNNPPSGTSFSEPAPTPVPPSDLCANVAPRTIPIIPAGTHITGRAGYPNFQSYSTDFSLAGVAAGIACYSSVVLELKVSTACDGSTPAGQTWPAACDPVDRFARVTFDDFMNANGRAVPFVLLEAVTPYGGDALWERDVTDYLVSTSGDSVDAWHSYTVFVDTQADPTGTASGTDAGFDVEANFILTPGARYGARVEPLLRQSITNGAPVFAELAPPADGASHVRLDLVTSGHGAVGPRGCDEFCPEQNVIMVDNDTAFSESPWFACAGACPAGAPVPCPANATAWRANACPAQPVQPFSIPLVDTFASGQHRVAFAVPGVQGSFDVGLAAVYSP